MLVCKEYLMVENGPNITLQCITTFQCSPGGIFFFFWGGGGGIELLKKSKKKKQLSVWKTLSRVNPEAEKKKL